MGYIFFKIEIFSLTDEHREFMDSIMLLLLSCFSCVRFCATPWTVAHQAPPSMGFSRQEYWSGLPFPSPGDFPNPGIEPRSPTFPADTITSEPPGKPRTVLQEELKTPLYHSIINLPSFLITNTFSDYKTDYFVNIFGIVCVFFSLL